MSRAPILIGIVILLEAVGSAQPPALQFEGPVAGFIYSRQSHSLRPVLGIPGSSYMGPAMLNDVDSASISPGAGWAWVTRSGHSTFIRGLSAGVPAELSPDGLIDAVDRV